MDLKKIYYERFLLQKEYLDDNKTVRPIEPVVSVCVITYQHKHYIRDCIEGILMQKVDFPFEIIIGEDGSTDGTREICIEYAERYPQKIRLYLRDRELSHLYDSDGNYVCRFNGKWTRESAKGQFIALCEGDDYWTDPLKLQKQVNFLKANLDYGLVHTDFDTYYQKEDYFLKKTHSIYGIDLKDNCTIDYWNLFGKAMATIKTVTVCFRSQFFKKWQDEMPINQWVIGDFPTFFYIALYSKIGYINDSTAVYRSVFSGSASNVGRSMNKKVNIRKTYVDIRLFFFKRFDLNLSYRRALIRDLRVLMDLGIISNDKKLLKEYLGIINQLDIEKEVGKLGRAFVDSRYSTVKKMIRYISRARMIVSQYQNRIIHPKILLQTVQRKFR